MKYKIWILTFIVAMPFMVNAQLKGIMQKAKSKVTQRADDKVDKEMDDILDKAEGKPTGDVASSGNATPAAPVQEDAGVKSFSKYDFIAGEKIVYYNNFETDADAELPLGWNTNGSGEVVSLNNFEGKWLRMHKPFIYMADNKTALKENYTIEFDVIMQLKNNGWMYPQFKFGMFSYSNDTANLNVYLKEQKKYACVTLSVSPGEYKSTKAQLESFADKKPYFSSDLKSFEQLEKYYGKIVHVAVQVQKERFRIWINGDKLFDIPKAVPVTYAMDQLFFEVGATNYAEEQYGMYLGNIKIAEGLPDTRHKLIDEGKFSTTAILFDVNKATIKPESTGALKEIADVLNQHKDIRIKITGHTDSDGKAEANLTLSQKRAEAVKNELANNYSIDASRIETEGKGATQPVADDKTKEGKAANRRVEFTKL